MIVLIVDDEPLARRRIASLLQYESGIEEIVEAGNGREAVELIRTRRPDLVLLDIQMPELDGLGVVREIGSAHMPPVIFVTAYENYAVRAFEVAALDYLLKPVERERFSAAFQRAVTRGMETSTAAQLNTLVEKLGAGSGSPSSGRIGVRSAGKVVFLRVSDIDWLEADGNNVRIHVGRDVHVVRDTLTRMEARLPAGEFMRVHRSATVNLSRIREIQPWLQGDYLIVLADGTKVTSGRSYRGRVKGMLDSAL